ncbi:MAG: damage-control phosphatase ARMT1 family protein [Bacillota bacterium]
MDLRLDCLPCIMRQTLESCRMVTNNQELIREVINQYAQLIPQLEAEKKAPEIVGQVQQLIKKQTGVADPYQEFKQRHLELAKGVYPAVKELITAADDSLQTALIMAATGNAIDAGLFAEVDVAEEVKKAMDCKFIVDDVAIFKEQLARADKILILGDNTGEAIFDKLLIEELHQYQVEIIYATRAAPVLNDVTIQEAKEVGLDQVSELISSGCKTPGTVLKQATQQFKQEFKMADIILSKGQGNLEGLSLAQAPIFFLLKAKCNLVARILEVNQGDLVFKFKQQGEVLN